MTAERREGDRHVAPAATVRADDSPLGSVPRFGRNIDYNATGSTPKRRERSSVRTGVAATTIFGAATTAHARADNYAVTFVHKDMALVKSERGLYAARRGMVLPNAGRVLSVKRWGSKWLLVTDTTIITEAD